MAGFIANVIIACNIYGKIWLLFSLLFIIHFHINKGFFLQSNLSYFSRKHQNLIRYAWNRNTADKVSRKSKNRNRYLSAANPHRPTRFVRTPRISPGRPRPPISSFLMAFDDRSGSSSLRNPENIETLSGVGSNKEKKKD